MKVERWNPKRDGEPTESKLARKLETLGNDPVVSLDATLSRSGG